MKSILLSTMLLGSVLATGCASVPQDAAQPQAGGSELVYRTGSNIPVRDKTPATKEEKEKQSEESRRTMQQMQSTGAGTPLKTN
ncbi:MAG: hypothetical protein ABI781_09435 [Burkholderiales bacterium]